MAFVFVILIFFVDQRGCLISIAYCPFFHFCLFLALSFCFPCIVSHNSCYSPLDKIPDVSLVSASEAHGQIAGDCTIYLEVPGLLVTRNPGLKSYSCILTIVSILYMSHLMIKPTKWHMRPVKTQISLGIRCPHEERLCP